MTLNELKSAVSALLSETVSERDPMFLGAANRSLEMLSTEIPSLKALTIPIIPAASYVVAELIEHSGGKKNSLTLSGAAYSFKVSGIGSYTVRDSSGVVTRDFDTPLSTIRGFITGGTGEITFEGDFCYTVFALTVYDRLRGQTVEDIPNGSGESVISVDDYADDILSVCEKPRDSSGRIVSEARTVGRSIIFPRAFSGLATISYERRPSPITESTVFIDAEPDTSSVLPLLTAYFLTLDRDADIAAEYLSRAKSSISALLRRRLRGDAEYTDVTGWA